MDSLPLGMLELRPSCELCGVALDLSGDLARICTYECTFCEPCATWKLYGICPNCDGELVVRPRRTENRLAKNPASTDEVRRDHDVVAHQTKVNQRLLAGDLPEQVWVNTFVNERTGVDDAGYYEKAAEMNALAVQQPGFLGVDSVRGADGVGITVSRWSSIAALVQWRTLGAHSEAQRTGRANWYLHYRSDVSRVDRISTFERP
jgi:uncharacterized protein